MIWETIIGLETHVELSTAAKLLCPCPSAFGGEANTRCCPVCAGLPGALPVLNPQAVEYAVRAGLALGCEISGQVLFDRKHYFYPDLPKGYQVTQFARPIARNGLAELGNGKTVRIADLHLEEDAGRLLHGAEGTACDHNRCGVPLIEIVTAPDFRTADEVLDYLELLRGVLRCLGVSDGKLEEGSLRCDVNLSVRPAGSTVLGQRTELKNLGSFKAVSRAIAHESLRQTTLLEAGDAVLPETRRWDEEAGVSHPMRPKETPEEYRFLPEPDLPLFPLSPSYVDALRAALPELPRARQRRYEKEYGLSLYDAGMLTSQEALAALFESAVALGTPSKQCANWIMGEVLRALSSRGIEAGDMTLSPTSLARLIALVEDGTLNRGTAARVFDALFDTGDDVDVYVALHGLSQITDRGRIGEVVEAVFAAYPKSVADCHAGKEKALDFLVGQTMRLLSGRGDPRAVNRAVRERLSRKV